MVEIRREARWILIALYLLAIIIYGLMIARYLNSPLRFDETEFAVQTEGILRHGVPKLLHSEEKNLYYLHDHAIYSRYNARYGMWHPPLYLYSLATAAVLFGVGNIPLRAVGLLWFALSLWLVWRITAILHRESLSPILQGIPLALALLTPLLAEGSFFIDIDNTSLTFSLLLFAYYFLKDPEDISTQRLILLGLIYLVSLWSKLTTPFIMLASVVIYHCMNGNIKRGFYQGLIIGGVGVLLFTITYWVYCALLSYPLGFMFDFTYWGKKDAFLMPNKIISSLHSLRWNFVWISPPLFIMLAVLVAIRMRNYILHRKLERVDFLVIFSVSGIMAYALWGGVWGKYTVPPVLAGVIAVGIQLANSLRSVKTSNPLIVGAALVIMAIVHYLAVPALQLRYPGIHLGKMELIQLITDTRSLPLVMTIAIFILFFLIFRRIVDSDRNLPLLFTSLLLYLLVVNPINSMKVMFLSDEISPYRPFHERGFVQTVQYLNANLSSTDVILSPKEMGYYFHGKYYQTEHSDGLVKTLALTSVVSHIIDSEMYPILRDRDILLNEFRAIPIKKIGDYVIYRTPGKNLHTSRR